jgi:hypothetical protein
MAIWSTSPEIPGRSVLATSSREEVGALAANAPAAESSVVTQRSFENWHAGHHSLTVERQVVAPYEASFRAATVRSRKKNGVSRKDAKAAKEKLFVFLEFFAAWREIILPDLNSSHLLRLRGWSQRRMVMDRVMAVIDLWLAVG